VILFNFSVQTSQSSLARPGFGRIRAWPLVLCVFGLVIPLLSGQTSVPSGPPGSDSEAAAAAQANRGGKLGAGKGDTLGALIHWGPFGVRPLADYSLIYETGMQVAPGHAISTYLQTVSTGVDVDVGDNWRFDYAASWLSYSHGGLQDSFNQRAGAQGKLARKTWMTAFTEDYSAMTTVLVETARQTKQQTSSTEGKFIWFPVSQFSADFTATQKLTFAERLADTLEWSGTPSVSYHPTQDIGLGIAVADGYVLVYHGPDLRYVRPSARASWQLTSKTMFSADVGQDVWRFNGSRGGETKTVYYRGGATLNPFEHTSLILTVQQSNAAVPFKAQLSKTQGSSLFLQQRLLGHLQLAVGIDQQKNRYIADLDGLPTVRSDSLLTYSGNLSLSVLRRGSVGILYRYTKNSSNLPGFGFITRQVGLEVSFHY
jgi:hypothetical protein